MSKIFNGNAKNCKLSCIFFKPITHFNTYSFEVFMLQEVHIGKLATPKHLQTKIKSLNTINHICKHNIDQLQYILALIHILSYSYS